MVQCLTSIPEITRAGSEAKVQGKGIMQPFLPYRVWSYSMVQWEGNENVPA